MNSEHEVNIDVPTTHIDWDLKEFSLYVESYDSTSAIIKLERAIEKLKNGSVSFSQPPILIDDVKVSYSYPHRPHCTSIYHSRL